MNQELELTNKNTLHENELLTLLKNAKEIVDQLGFDSRIIRPILRNKRNGQIIDGKHRLEADPDWPVIEVDIDPDSVSVDFLRCILNYGRRQVSSDELRSYITEIARKTGWNAPKISKFFSIPISTVYFHIPSKYKRDYIIKIENGTITQESKNLQDCRFPKKRNNEESRKLTSTLDPLKIPESVLIESKFNEIYEERPGAPPIFLARAASRELDIAYEDALQYAEEYYSHNKHGKQIKSRNHTMFYCPLCKTFKPKQSHTRTLNTLKQEDDKYYNIYLEGLKKQGWTE